MLQLRRGSSCAASRTIGGCAVTVTVFDDWRSARREIRNGTAASCFEVSTLLKRLSSRVLSFLLLLNRNRV